MNPYPDCEKCGKKYDPRIGCMWCDEQYDNQVEKEIRKIIDKLHRGEATDEDWQRFVELTHWEDDEDE